MMTTPSMSAVRPTASHLYGVLRRLTTGERLGERVPGFIPPPAAAELARRLVPRVDYGFLSGVPNLGCIGMAYKTAAYDPALRERYYAEASAWEARQREAVAPLQPPIDALLTALHVAWPQGVVRERVDGRPMFVGTVRVQVRGEGSPPHQDLLARDAGPDNPRVRALRGHFAATLFLAACGTGGQLDVWDRMPFDERTVTRNNRAVDAYDRAALEAPDLTLSPGPGDLILYDNRRVHSARPNRDGLQVTVSAVLGYRGENEPMTVWS